MARTYKLDRAKAAEIRARAASGEDLRALAAEFGVSRPSVVAVVQGRIYQEQPLPVQPRPDPREPYRERILKVLRGSGRPSGLLAREIAERAAMAVHTVKAYLRHFREAGIVARVGSGAETRYRLARSVAAPSAPRGDRPRSLGLRNAWLRQHGAVPLEAIND
jgi:hypothetical protein